jgi:hypothetical protein
MTWIKNILREIFSLFVDDGAFALAILIWLSIVRWATSRLSSVATAIILFAGLALILLESATRYARLKQNVKK